MCARSRARSDAREIRVLGPPNDGFKAVYYGVESGLFKRLGVIVEPTLVSSGAAGSAAVIGGSAEVVYTNILTLIQAHARDIPLVFLAPGALMLAGNSPTFTLVRKEERSTAAATSTDGSSARRRCAT